MNAVVQLRAPRRAAAPPARIALLGTGTVGSAFAARYLRLRAQGLALPEIAWISNSRVQRPVGDDLLAAMAAARGAPARPGGVPPWAEGEGLRPGDVLVDASASERVADWHPEWLARGVHVVTANKLGTGGDLGRAQAISDAQAEGARYGDSATVGAGLPLLRAIRELRAGGDRILAIEGVLSGSLAFLCNGYDGHQPFSCLLEAAGHAGYTEPDPRVDLSGEDVRRKLLILARAAGHAVEAHAIGVQSLLPDAMRDADAAHWRDALPELDAVMAERLAQAQASGSRLRFIGRFSEGRGEVGLRELPAAHVLASGEGSDNRVAIYSDRYRERPLLVQGPGAGAEVTAAALLDDVIRVLAA